MRSSTASETHATVRSAGRQSSAGARIVVPGRVVEEEAPQPHDRRAARGVLIGILLGAGAWTAIWFVASALWHRG